MKFVSRMFGLGLFDALAFVLAFLAGVTCEGRSQVLRQARLVEELVELFPLAISERVHRVDHDGTRAPLVAGGARIAASIIGMKKQSDFPEPVPVVTAKL
jgi:hypothetical protein